MLDASTNVDASAPASLTMTVADSVEVNSGACPQKGGAGSETGGACGPTRSNLDLLQPGSEEGKGKLDQYMKPGMHPQLRPEGQVTSFDVEQIGPEHVKRLPDSGDNEPCLSDLLGGSSEEDAVMPLFEPGEGMEKPGQPDAAQAARPTAEAEQDAAQAPKPLAEAAEAEKQRAEAQTGLSAAPSPAPSQDFETPRCVPLGQGYHVPEHLKQMVLQAQCSVSLH